MKNSIKKLTLAMGLAAAAQCASAQEGWYIGIGFGQSTTHDWATEDEMLGTLDDLAVLSGVFSFSGSVDANSDDKDSAWKIFGGYQFSPNWGVEASYMDLGEATADASAVGFFNGNSILESLYIKVKSEATAFVFDGVGKLPVAPWCELFAKAGLYRADLEVTATAGVTSGGTGNEISDSESDNSTGLHFAVGADFNVTQNIAIRAEWGRLSKVDFQDSDTDLDMLSISGVLKF